MAMTAREIYETYNVKISPQKLGAFRAASRRAAGPPFRMVIAYPPPVLTPEEEEEALAQAEYNDDMGIIVEPDIYTVLDAQSVEDAKAEAEQIWQARPNDGAIGYAILSRDWSCKHVFYLNNDELQNDTEAARQDVRAG